MKAIVYTSNTGHTAAYAEILGAKTGLPVYSMKEAETQLDRGTPIVYLGWLFANSVVGYRRANKRFRICAVCAVGLCDTGTAIAEVRKRNAIPRETPVFTMQGGMDKTKLISPYRLGIHMLTKAVASKKERTEDDERMLYLLTHDKDYVAEENTASFAMWYEENK